MGLMPAILAGITIFCFGASYSLALIVELVNLLWPRRWLRAAGLALGIAGFVAHTLFVLVQPLALVSPVGSLVFLAWVLAVFYLYGSLHHRKVAWGLFVLPLVLGLTVLAGVERGHEAEGEAGQGHELLSFHGESFWQMVHGWLMFLAAVGICVGFVASVMYLVQVHRLKAKTPPGQGVRLLSLERLEAMSKRAIIFAFPLLTAGILVGLVLLLKSQKALSGWEDPKLLSAAVLWLVFVIVVYLRYARRVHGRQVAVLTIVAFVLLVLSLAAPEHVFLPGGGP
jgi:ABC-type transport system involved in cytochrome c biogenesis permease subunit